MSCNEWESGTIKLPTAGFAPFRKALEAHTKDRMEKAYAKTQEFWQTLTPAQKRDAAKYSAAVSEFISRVGRDRTGRHTNDPQVEALVEDTQYLLGSMVHYTWEAGRRVGQGKPRRVLRTDVNFPNNKTTRFQDGDLFIAFDRKDSTVLWSVSDNNHAVEHAHETLLSGVFFKTLNKVRFTRSSGGVIVGNNEYNGADQEVGGGANYVAWSVGPVGKKESAHTFRPYLDAEGRQVSPPRPTSSFSGRW